MARVVAPIERQVLALVADPIGQMRLSPGEMAAEPLAVGVDQQLVMVEAEAALGIVRTIDAVAIELAGLGVGQITVPDVVGALGQRDAVELVAASAVEQTELDLLGA